MRKVEVCKYHPFKPANKKCLRCKEGLCKYCGRRENNETYCNDCDAISTNVYKLIINP